MSKWFVGSSITKRFTGSSNNLQDVNIQIVHGEEKPEVPFPKPRKLKKISIEDIADKINKTRKRPERALGDAGKLKNKQPLPQFGKTSSRKKGKKREKDVPLTLTAQGISSESLS